MTRPVKLAVVAGLIVVMLLAGGLGAKAVYLDPAAEKRDQMERYRRDIASLQDSLGAQFAVRDRLDEISATTLGRELDRVEHALRARLTRLGEGEGLADVIVSNGRPVAVRSPVGDARGVSTQIRRALRARPDFLVVRGQLSGTGDLDAVLRVLAGVQAQPWIHRVEGFSLQPADRQERRRFAVRIDFATIFAPDLGPRAGQDLPPVADVPDEVADMVRQIASRNVFRRPDPPREPEPEPVVEEPRVAEEPPPPPPPPPYDQWRLTGIAEGNETIAFVTRTSGRRSLMLAPGERVLDAVFEGGSGEVAVFRIGGTRYRVQAGQTLAERAAID